MLRPLLWLRWTLAWRATNLRNRIATIGLMLLLFLAFSPVIVGGAFAAYAGVIRQGPPAVVVAFGLCQLAWIWLGLLSGAMGRLFDLDQLIRYPVRTRTVYLVNLFATLTEPLAFMTLPTLIAVTLAMGQRAGLAAGAVTAMGALLLMVTTSALMQLLLALLDDLLRREWMRFVAAGFTSFTFLGVQWLVRDLGDHVMLPFARQQLSLESALRLGAELLGRIPTITAAAALATAPLTQDWARAGWLTLATVGGIALSVAAGTRLLEATALRGGGGGGSHVRKRAAGTTRGSFAGVWSRLPGALGPLVAREVWYVVRTPQLLYQILIPPIMVVFFYAIRHASLKDQPGFAFAMLTTSLIGRNLMLFGHDGPGVRTMFLLPIHARTLVLAKDIGYLVTVAAQLLVILAVVLGVGIHVDPAFATTVSLGAIAVLMIAMIVGNHYSIANPSKPASRGFARRGGGSLASLVGVLVVLLAGAAVAGLVWLAHRLGGDAADVAGALVALALAAGSVALWWASLGRSGAAFIENREKLIEVLAKADAT